jgi:3-phytase
MKACLPLLSLLLLAGCATRPSTPLSPPGASGAPHTVGEAYVSAEQAGDELDSLATWPTEDGATWVVATAKNSHRLLVFDVDSGELLRTVGERGTGPGQFIRPNGIAIHGDLAFVSERDGRRVQVLQLPALSSVGTFGEGELRSPYGVWVHEPVPGELAAYVTDSFMEGARFDRVPPFAQLDQRVRRYRLRLAGDGRLQVEPLGSFGDTSEANALRMVESIAGDPPFDRLLVVDEDARHAQTIHEYTLAGRYTGRKLPAGTFLAEPEGVALWACTADSGYWVVSDQLRPRTVFRLFDRHTLSPRGSFTGQVTAWTDGIALHAAGTARFPHGVLLAMHDDRAVTAFDLREIADALQLDPACR